MRCWVRSPAVSACAPSAMFGAQTASWRQNPARSVYLQAPPLSQLSPPSLTACSVLCVSPPGARRRGCAAAATPAPTHMACLSAGCTPAATGHRCEDLRALLPPALSPGVLFHGQSVSSAAHKLRNCVVPACGWSAKPLPRTGMCPLRLGMHDIVLHHPPSADVH